jgi:protein-L-isoaspartate(D-aspartate) O-methyltransferase
VRALIGIALLVLAAAVLPAGGETELDAAELRSRMVEEQLRDRSITNPTVLEAMEKVPRHEFVPTAQRGDAYADRPLPIGQGQTISQPYIVAYMTEGLELRASDRVLEIGTGSGYQAAVLAEIVSEVYTIEIIEALARRAAGTLERLDYDNVHVKVGDGYSGWPEHAPYDAIIVTAAAGHIPPALVEQLSPEGKIIIPIGPVYQVQTLMEVTKSASGDVRTRELLPVRFVPMTGDVQE